MMRERTTTRLASRCHRACRRRQARRSPRCAHRSLHGHAAARCGCVRKIPGSAWRPPQFVLAPRRRARRGGCWHTAQRPPCVRSPSSPGCGSIDIDALICAAASLRLGVRPACCADERSHCEAPFSAPPSVAPARGRSEHPLAAIDLSAAHPEQHHLFPSVLHLQSSNYPFACLCAAASVCAVPMARTAFADLSSLTSRPALHPRAQEGSGRTSASGAPPTPEKRRTLFDSAISPHAPPCAH